MRNFYTIIVLFLFCIISACNKDKTNESEAIDNKVSLSRKEMIAQRWQGRIDTVSYAIGVDVAMRLEQQFDKINYERINQAIADYYSGSKLYLSDKERVEAINTYNKLLAPKIKMDQEKKNIEEGAAFFKSNKKENKQIKDKNKIK